MKNKTQHHSLNRREFLKKTAMGCGVIASSTMSFPAIAIPKTEFKIGYMPILDHLTLLVSHAQDNNAFKKIQIEPKLFKSWNSVVGWRIEGRCD